LRERLPERVLQAKDETRHVVAAAEAREQHRELVGAEARDGVAGTQPPLEPVPRLHEELVGPVVAQPLVQVAEAVEVEEQHEQAVHAPLDRRRPAEARQESRARGELRQVVAVLELEVRLLVLSAEDPPLGRGARVGPAALEEARQALLERLLRRRRYGDKSAHGQSSSFDWEAAVCDAGREAASSV
jgi:hypothetical protein